MPFVCLAIRIIFSGECLIPASCSSLIKAIFCVSSLFSHRDQGAEHVFQGVSDCRKEPRLVWGGGGGGGNRVREGGEGGEGGGAGRNKGGRGRGRSRPAGAGTRGGKKRRVNGCIKKKRKKIKREEGGEEGKRRKYRREK